MPEQAGSIRDLAGGDQFTDLRGRDYTAFITHRGHQQIIRRLTTSAHPVGAPVVVVTFWPHPATVLSGSELKCLTVPDERAELLTGLGVDLVITVAFDSALANTSAEDFVRRLQAPLDFHHMLIGYDFALGKG